MKKDEIIINDPREYKIDFAACPGWFIPMEIEHLGTTQAETARRLGISRQTMRRLISGKIPLSPSWTQKLEYVLGVDAAFLNKMERIYRADLVKFYEFGEKEKAFLKLQPVNLLKKKKLISGKNEKELFRSLLRFYAVGDVKAWNLIWRSQLRNLSPKEGALRVAMLRQGELLAAKENCKNYKKVKFQKALKEAQKLVCQTENFSKAKEVFAKSGVSLVIADGNLTSIGGATRWLSSKKAMLLVNTKGGRLDQIWFSIFHEAKHVLARKIKTSYLSAGQKSPEEEKADAFAREILLTKKADKEVLRARTGEDLLALAKKYKSAVYVVAGRYADLTGDEKKFKKYFKYFKFPRGKWYV